MVGIIQQRLGLARVAGLAALVARVETGLAPSAETAKVPSLPLAARFHPPAFDRHKMRLFR
jgi:hypothetical protein